MVNQIKLCTFVNMINKQQVTDSLNSMFEKYAFKFNEKKSRMDFSFDIKNYLYGLFNGEYNIEVSDDTIESNNMNIYEDIKIKINNDEPISLLYFTENIDSYIEPINRETKLNDLI